MTPEEMHRVFEVIHRAHAEERAQYLCDTVRNELKKLTRRDQRALVKQELLRMLKPRRKKDTVHRFDKPVFRVIEGGRP
jgi:hypothetical protein